MSPSALEIIWGLCRNYVVHAWPFAIGHLFLAYIVFKDWRTIRREGDALKAWSEHGPATTECTQILTGFVEEARDWAQHGILVPVTDFSDRLDSLVTGMSDGIHSRVNLFLIIGIAGTFFALFEFAFVAPKILQEELGLVQLSNALNHSLAKAFPVGFIGLVATIAGHVLVSRPEGQLRMALSEATQSALTARRVARRNPIEAIEKALEPIRNLDQMLGQSMQLVIDRFSAQLAQTSDLIQKQFATLDQSVGSFRDTAESLKGSTRHLADLMQAVPQVLLQVNQVSQASHAQIQKLETMTVVMTQAIEDSTGSLRSAAADLSNIPSQLGDNLRQQLEGWTRQSATQWDRTCQEFLQGLQGQTASCVSQIQSATASLERAAQALEVERLNTADILRKVTEDSLKNLAAEARRHLGELDTALRERYPQAAEQLGEMSQRISQMLKLTGEAVKALTRHAQELKSVEEKWQVVNRELDGSVDKLARLSWEGFQKSMRDGANRLAHIDDNTGEILSRIDSRPDLWKSVKDFLTKPLW